MKLDYDCVRDVLIAIEELSNINDSTSSGFDELSVFDIEQHLESYTSDDIYYTILKLIEADYIRAEGVFHGVKKVELLVYDITFEGHQYLNSIRDPKIWKSIKGGSSSLTFSVILKAAEKLIMSQFGL